MLLFTEWKPLGDIGRNWIYVRAYELLRKILTPDLDKIDEFDQQIDWVEQRLTDIVTLGKKLNRSTTEVELEEILTQLQVKKPAPKSQIFQRIAFLIEFARIGTLLCMGFGYLFYKTGIILTCTVFKKSFFGDFFCALFIHSENEGIEEDVV